MNAFVLEDGVVYHTYSTYARGLEGLWSMYQWLDRAQRDGHLVTPPRRDLYYVKATRKKNRKWWDGLKQEQMMDIQTEKV